MLEIELDIFSGMPNPKWILSQREEQELMDRITADPTQVSPVTTREEQFSLGYRGLIVRSIKPDDGPWSKSRQSTIESLPFDEFRVGSKPAIHATVSDWLLQTSKHHKHSRVTDGLLGDIVKSCGLG